MFAHEPYSLFKGCEPFLEFFWIINEVFINHGPKSMKMLKRGLIFTFSEGLCGLRKIRSRFFSGACTTISEDLDKLSVEFSKCHSPIFNQKFSSSSLKGQYVRQDTRQYGAK